MPLAEIIASVYDKGVTTKTVQGIWQKLIDGFGTEIDVLINVSLEDIKKIDSRISVAIESFRNGTIEVVPGGGGQYGQILFEKEVEKPKVVTLDNF
jgi:PHP family Zn ribbon phosphoesterase